MSSSLLGILVYSGWTLLLVLGIASQRSWLTVAGKRAANSFGPDGKDVSEFSNRLCRAHGNCTENLPIFIGVVAVALWSNNAAITDPLVFVVVGARILQSVTHLLSTSAPAVTIRFAFFAIQCAILVWWVIQLALTATGA